MQDIGEESWQKFGAGKLSDLCKLLPEENEVNPLLDVLSLTSNSFTSTPPSTFLLSKSFEMCLYVGEAAVVL